MDYLWSPWRFKYIAGAPGDAPREDAPGRAACVLCRVGSAKDAREALVLGRGAHAYVVLNLFPYTSGHLMVVPSRHASSLSSFDAETTGEMMELAKRAERALSLVYRPDGFNVGINLGGAAGAGIAEHLHLHVVPRWTGDANFMTTVGETRVLPEELGTTYDKLEPHFRDLT